MFYDRDEQIYASTLGLAKSVFTDTDLTATTPQPQSRSQAIHRTRIFPIINDRLSRNGVVTTLGDDAVSMDYVPWVTWMVRADDAAEGVGLSGAVPAALGVPGHGMPGTAMGYMYMPAPGLVSTNMPAASSAYMPIAPSPYQPVPQPIYTPSSYLYLQPPGVGSQLGSLPSSQGTGTGTVVSTGTRRATRNSMRTSTSRWLQLDVEDRRALVEAAEGLRVSV